MPSKRSDNIHFPLLFKDLDADVIGLTLEEKIHRGGADAQSADRELWNSFRQAGAHKNDPVACAFDSQAQAGLDQHKRRCRCPCLRRTCHGVKRRTFSSSAFEAAKEFRKAMQFHVTTDVEQREHHSARQISEAIAPETARDKRVIVRPDRTVVIRERIVPRLG